MRLILAAGIVLVTLFWIAAPSQAGDADAARRGAKALQTRAFNPPFWSKAAWDNLWKQWGVEERPANYSQAIRDRYGLHTAPFDNGGYPMGMRETTYLFQQGIASDCMLCHGGSIDGKSYVGLGNASLDMQSLYEEMNLSEGRKKNTPFTFCHVRGTNEAGSMSVFLIAYREPNLKLRRPALELDQHDNLCEDVPAWWLLKKKKTMYHTGSTDARSVRSLMQFMMHPLNTAEAIQRDEATFRDVQAYLLSLEPPKYPFPIDAELAHKGETLFRANCARCHGTYGEKWTYPNKIVPIDVIGTDRTRFEGISEKFGRYYNQSWFAQEQSGWLGDDYAVKATAGYQAPPLDGIWATAPYFHNGSAPTVYHVLNSKARPKYFTRSYRTDRAAYDPVKLGWKITVLKAGADDSLSDPERRKIYDTTQPGRGNGGHTFGDQLSDEERSAVIEYLKTL
jgi:mono/diheme cytochrome c family protein